MTKCWAQSPKRRNRKTHSDKGAGGHSGSDYRTKPHKGHQWTVERDADGKPIPGTRTCVLCKLPAPGRGRAARRVAPRVSDTFDRHVNASFAVTKDERKALKRKERGR